MALLAGSAELGTGLAGALMTQIELKFPIPNEIARKTAWDMADAFATAIVTHIKENADVIIKTTDSGLQRSTLVGTPTNGPTADVTLSGAVD
jgi:hypothetical protein